MATSVSTKQSRGTLMPPCVKLAQNLHGIIMVLIYGCDEYANSIFIDNVVAIVKRT